MANVNQGAAHAICLRNSRVCGPYVAQRVVDIGRGPRAFADAVAIKSVHEHPGCGEVSRLLRETPSSVELRCHACTIVR